MNKDIITLTPQEIKTLKEFHSPLYFQNDFDLIYESQVPNVGVLFLEGEVKLLKKKRVLSSLPFGSLIGLYHLMNNSPLPLGVKVCKNSSVLVIEKTLITEALTQKSGILYQIISAL